MSRRRSRLNLIVNQLSRKKLKRARKETIKFRDKNNLYETFGDIRRTELERKITRRNKDVFRAGRRKARAEKRKEKAEERIREQYQKS